MKNVEIFIGMLDKGKLGYTYYKTAANINKAWGEGSTCDRAGCVRF